jgi:hypothetical protein
MVHESDKVVNPGHRPPKPPRKYPRYSVDPCAIVRPEGLSKLKIPIKPATLKTALKRSLRPTAQEALTALQAVRTTSPLIYQCQKALNDISARHVVGLFWVPGHGGVRGNEIADGLARDGSALRLLGPEPALGVSRCDIRKKLRCWQISQHRASWCDLGNTLKQARELISGPCPGTRIKLLSFNRNQSRVLTGLLTGHNTLRRHLHLMGLLDSPICRKCGVKEESSAHILCECEALAVLRYRYLGSFFLEPEDVKSISFGAIWSFSKATGLP